MPRNTRYRKEFQAQNDVYWRLDIIPGQNAIFNYATAPTVTLGDETVLSIGNIKLNYRDNLVFGLPEIEPLEVEFDFSNLPADLKLYLSQSFDPDTRYLEMIACNFCILSSGTDGINYSPVYVGLQTPQLTSEVTISYKQASITKIKFQPISTAVLSRCKWLNLNKYFDNTDEDSILNPVDTYKEDFIYAYWDWTDIQDGTSPWFDGPSAEVQLSNRYGNTDPDENFYVYPYQLRKVFEVMRREMQSVFKYLTRQAAMFVVGTPDADNIFQMRRSSNFSGVDGFGDVTTNYLDWEYNRYVGADGVIKVHEANTIDTLPNSLNNRQGPAVAFNNIFIPFVVDLDNFSDFKFSFINCDGTIGGIWNKNDEGSFAAQYKTFFEFMSAISEWACSKMTIGFTFTSGILKMTYNVFGALEATNSTLATSIDFLEEAASEELTAEIGFITSSVETGVATATKSLPATKPSSPFLDDLAKSQTFSIKNCVLSWDVAVPLPNAQDNFKASIGNFSRKFDGSTYKGWLYQNLGPIPCTTLFWAQGTVKVNEYVEIGDTTKTVSPNTYYTTGTAFDQFSIAEISNDDSEKKYLDVYRWMLEQYFNVGTPVQLNKCFSGILTNQKNWAIEDIEIYHKEQFELGMPFGLLGHMFENGVPTAYDAFLELPNKGCITSVQYEVLTGKYTLACFQTGLLME